MSESATTVESVNPNVNVVEQLTDDNGKVSLESGESALTFDELDELTSKKAQKKEPKKDEKEKDLTSDDKKGKETKESKDSEPKDEDKKAEKAEKEAKELRKTIKAKLKDQEMDIDEEALVPVKVNGQTEYWTMKDLLAQQSGKVAYDKKFQEIDTERKKNTEVERKLQSVEQNIKAIFEEKDETIRMFKIAQVAGVDPIEFRNKFFNDNIKLLEKYYTMTDDERKADAKEYEARIHKHRADTLEQTIKAQQSQRELLTKIDQVRASHKISEQEFFDKFESFNEQVQSGKMDPQALDPEYIANAIQVDKVWAPAAEKLDSLKLGLSTQDREKILIDVVTNAMKLGIKSEDVGDIIDEVYGTGKAKRKIAEKKKDAAEFTSGRKEMPNNNPKASSPLFFDEII